MNCSLSFFTFLSVDSSVIGGYLKIQSRIVFPAGVSVPSLILTMTTEAFVSLVLVHRSLKSKLWACSKLQGRTPAARPALSQPDASKVEACLSRSAAVCVDTCTEIYMHSCFRKNLKMDSSVWYPHSQTDVNNLSLFLLFVFWGFLPFLFRPWKHLALLPFAVSQLERRRRITLWYRLQSF